MNFNRNQKAATWLSLFTSGSTLICCALPSLFVALGAGAVFASLLSVAPWLMWFGENKHLVFPAAGVMLLVGGIFLWRARTAPCPADPVLGAACMRSRKMSAVLYWVSVGLFLMGVFTAFIWPYLVEA